MGRIFAVPDIHGRNDLLQLLLKKLYDEQKLDHELDHLIFLGDMVDRGEDSAGVIDTVRALCKKPNVVALAGNHEDLLLNALRRGRYDDFQLWMWNGGGSTLRSFGDLSAGTATDKNPIPKDYLEWLESLPVQYALPGFFFSHAPVPCERRRLLHLKGEAYTRSELTWTYDHDEAAIARNLKGTIGVCGHIHALGRGIFAPRYYPHYYFLDAGCGCDRDAPLVATEVTEKRPIWVYPPGIIPKPQPKRKHLPPQPKL